MTGDIFTFVFKNVNSCYGDEDAGGGASDATADVYL